MLRRSGRPARSQCLGRTSEHEFWRRREFLRPGPKTRATTPLFNPQRLRTGTSTAAPCPRTFTSERHLVPPLPYVAESPHHSALILCCCPTGMACLDYFHDQQTKNKETGLKKYPGSPVCAGGRNARALSKAWAQRSCCFEALEQPPGLSVALDLDKLRALTGAPAMASVVVAQA